MNVTTFRLEKPTYEFVGEPIFGNRRAIYVVPTLPAYALIDSRFDMLNFRDPEIVLPPPIYEIIDDKVLTPATILHDIASNSAILTIYHHGVKDYALLFPHIDNIRLRERLGAFAMEASLAFESQSWVSYSLMVGGVLEGLLYHQYGNYKFEKLISLAAEEKIISQQESNLINEIRLARNKIHASRFEESIINRKMALELSIAYDKLLKRNWNISSLKIGVN